MQIISLSASANKLSNIQKQAKEYAALIMEELDPDNAGYIMVRMVHLTTQSLMLYIDKFTTLDILLETTREKQVSKKSKMVNVVGVYVISGVYT